MKSDWIHNRLTRLSKTIISMVMGIFVSNLLWNPFASLHAATTDNFGVTVSVTLGDAVPPAPITNLTANPGATEGNHSTSMDSTG